MNFFDGLFDEFLRKTKESGRKTWRSASRSEFSIVKVADYWGYKICHIDAMQRWFYEHICMRVVTCAHARARAEHTGCVRADTISAENL